MSDPIERQDAIDAIHCDITVTGAANAETVARTIGEFVERIKALPAAQPERKRGKWIDNDGSYVCDQCGEPCASEIMGKPRDRFCKWCGARMDGGGPLAMAYRKEGDE